MKEEEEEEEEEGEEEGESVMLSAPPHPFCAVQKSNVLRSTEIAGSLSLVLVMSEMVALTIVPYPAERAMFVNAQSAMLSAPGVSCVEVSVMMGSVTTERDEPSLSVGFTSIDSSFRCPLFTANNAILWVTVEFEDGIRRNLMKENVTVISSYPPSTTKICPSPSG